MNNALITDEQRVVLLANGLNPWRTRTSIRRPWSSCSRPMRARDIDPDDHDHDHAFGLCDLGLGMPEIGWVSLNELATVRGGLGLPIERDLSFRAEKRLSAYARDARLAGQIIV